MIVKSVILFEFKHLIQRRVLSFVIFGILVSFSPVLIAEVNDTGTETPVAMVNEKNTWTGIDVSIVGKYANKYGRPPREPYINTDKGDLLLFVFTLAGVIGGFIIGFNVHRLFYEKK